MPIRDTNKLCVGVYTLGCKVNQYESEAIQELFQSAGYEIASPSGVCDVYVINTCTVTAESDRKARQFIRRAVNRNPDACVIVTGCYAQVAPTEVAAIEGVDYVVGNREKLRVLLMAEDFCKVKAETLPEIDVSDLNGAAFEPMCITRFDRTRAYVKIEDGCESRCTYCIIPDARGQIRSKPQEDVLKEVEALTKNGCPEIVLTGIETASYGKDLASTSLSTLLREVERIPSIGRIRLGSLDPSLIKPKFVSEIVSLSCLAPHFHLSMQSGSDAVLRRMKRKYNRAQAMESMRLLREALPCVQFTTDIIVGFPGESESDFEDTVTLIEQGFMMTHIFPYSKRKGTPAAEMTDQIPDAIKKQRCALLADVASRVRREILLREIEEYPETTVLFETYQRGYAVGHTPNFIEVRVKSDHALPKIPLPVRLTALSEDICDGILL